MPNLMDIIRSKLAPQQDLGRIVVEKNRGDPIDQLMQNTVNQMPQIPQSVRPSIPASMQFDKPKPVNVSQKTQKKQPEKTQEKASIEDQQWVQSLLRVGVPLGAIIAAGVNKRILPQAAGFSQGFSTAQQSIAETRQRQESEASKADAKKWDDAYDTAIKLSKTGPMGGIKEITPQQLDALAQQVYNIKYPENTRAGESASSKPKEESRYKVGQEIDVNGKKYKIVGFDSDGEPLVE